MQRKTTLRLLALLVGSFLHVSALKPTASLGQQGASQESPAPPGQKRRTREITQEKISRLADSNSAVPWTTWEEQGAGKISRLADSNSAVPWTTWEEQGAGKISRLADSNSAAPWTTREEQGVEAHAFSDLRTLESGQISGLYGKLGPKQGGFGLLGDVLSGALAGLEGALRSAMSFINNATQGLSSTTQRSSQRLRAFWSSVARTEEREASGEAVRADPIGISIGFVAVIFAGYSVYRSRREANRIISLFEANTQIKELADKAARGEKLPSIVIIRGTINADGRDVYPVAPSIHGLKERVGEIEQPKNAWIEIARQAKRDPQLKGIADAVVERTGVDADDVPDVPEPADLYARATTEKAEGPLVLSEILVARICAKHQWRTEDKNTKKVTIKRPCRNESYNCFHGRREAEGLHLLDLDGSRADLVLPPADAVGLTGIPEPPPLFLPVNDVWTEFTHYLRKDGLTGPGGRHQRLDDLPPMRLSDPYTLLSEFIFIDIQSQGDLGDMPGNQKVLSDIAEAYRSSSGPAKFLWEPRGFYDSVKGGGYDDVPAYAAARFRRTEMVSAGELTERAQAAARENSRSTPYCEPTFTRAELEQRRNQENCFRYTELAVPRGTPVTVLARPMVAEAGTGEGADCQIRLVAPLAVDEVRDPKELKADRFRFRILKGHTVENLLRHRDLNVNAYYGLAVVGLAFAGWAAVGYPGMSG